MSELLDIELDDYWEWDAHARKNGWTDGLPLCPPTEERVDELVQAMGGRPEHLVGLIGPAKGRATVEQIAIQCTMAGCRPEHGPVVVAAIEAMLEPRFNLSGVQSTTNPCAPLTTVSGPVVDELGFHAGDGSFGGGSHASAAVGRAVRLVLWNLGHARPGEVDKSSVGQPAKYLFCAAENGSQSPWTSIHEDAGLGSEASAVTVFACQSPWPLFVPGSAERILNVIAETLPTSGVNMFHAAGQFLLVFAVKPAQELARAGYSKDEVRQCVFENARYRLGDLRASGVLDPREAHTMYWGHGEDPPDLSKLADDALLPMVRSKDDIHIVVSGGDAQWWMGFCPGWGNYGGNAVTKPITELR